MDEDTEGGQIYLKIPPGITSSETTLVLSGDSDPPAFIVEVVELVSNSNVPNPVPLG